MIQRTISYVQAVEQASLSKQYELDTNFNLREKLLRLCLLILISKI